MNYRTLGKTGIQVSNICFGAMSFGGIADEATSLAMFNRCREVGINFLIAQMCMQVDVQRKFWANVSPTVGTRLSLHRSFVCRWVTGSIRRVCPADI